ncbi:MAG TPA: choice-of-anchor tandem repeat GloVer-containing protein [Terriglobales bacterium]|nr:choice-of-anchor tandem repeat GloVer-containing protein [Terriglobales bacterium]
MKRLFLLAAAVVACCTFAAAQQYKVLYNFAGPPTDGQNAIGPLILDNAGNLYGETLGGGSGANGGGTVFEVSPGSNGAWTETVLYNFCSNYVNQVCLDGTGSEGGLNLDPQGNLYGTTEFGGTNNSGLLFELSPPSAPGESWTYSVLHNFCSDFVNNQCLDGAYPYDQPIFDSVGNLYGTAGGGNGQGAGGVVWELTPGEGQWNETILYNFCTLGQGNDCPDGDDLFYGVTFDRFGNLFGTTERGGTGGLGGGVLFELSPSSGGWTETVLFKFRASTGFPVGGVVLDPLGDIYGTSWGPQNNDGSVFRWSPRGGASEFQFDGADGADPGGSLLLDLRRHELLGVTGLGGEYGSGNVFELTPPAHETVIYSFCSQPNCADGGDPGGGVIEDAVGNLYGATRTGGASGMNGYGVVYEIAR